MRQVLGILAVGAMLATAGCGQLDLTPEGDPSRALVGQIEYSSEDALPPGAVLTIRVVDTSALPPNVLGTQTIENPGPSPVAFHVNYFAVDDLLRRGVNVEARLSFGGKVRYYNVNHYVVTLGTAGDSHSIHVNPVGP
ncbi:MAG TPA: YbaY family lipoprotein [Opitutaceae bacterium]|jgi:uncharacterized lipoprotein YbaY